MKEDRTLFEKAVEASKSSEEIHFVPPVKSEELEDAYARSKDSGKFSLAILESLKEK